MPKRQKKPKFFADPTIDSGFKMLFSKPNKHLLINFINIMFRFVGENKISDVQYLPTEFPDVEGRCAALHAICDLRVVTDKKDDIIIEMQRKKHKGFLERMQYYMGRAVGQTLRPGQSYATMSRTYILVIGLDNLLDQNEEDRYENTVAPYLVENHGKMLWKYIEIKRFLRLKSADITKFDLFEQWIHFFGTCAKQKEVPQEAHGIIKEAYDQMTFSDSVTKQKYLDTIEGQSKVFYQLSIISS